MTEQYVVNALTFAEAEERITEKMAQYISGEFDVKDIKPAQYKEVLFMSDGDKMVGDTRWYKAKLQFITIDEKTEKEKRTTATYLVQACSLHNTLDNIDTVMQGTMIDYVQANVAETQIVDVFSQTGAQAKAAELMARMAEALRDRERTVESIVDEFVTTATPELRRQLIERLTAMREGGMADTEPDGKTKAAGE